MIKRVGIIGGGQLAWMMADAAAALGVELVVQTPQKTDPAVAIAADVVLAAIDDATATAQLAASCDVITFENEFIDLAALSRLADQGVCFYPRLSSLAPLLDKYQQRSYLAGRGIPTPSFVALDANPDPATLNQFGFPVVLKARRHGYDGQGTHVVEDQTDLSRLVAKSSLWLLEEFVPFDRELAVMAARSLAGDIVVYPVVETQQDNQVCRRVLVTRDMNPSVVEQVEAIARKLLTRLDYVGIMGIEFFLTHEGKVLVNELAPRTHNSGHYTLDACVTSQFEQQLRAVCGLPLGHPALYSAGAVMVNLLGYETAESNYLEKRQQLAQIPGAHVYWYGKTVSRPGRKLGHVTVLLDRATRDEALKLAEAIESVWYP
jgi:5-(carboxyamino)imidazole ribonucleotide synthase